MRTLLLLVALSLASSSSIHAESSHLQGGIQAAGEGPFTIYPNQLSPAPGAKGKGLVLAGAPVMVTESFHEENLKGGLARIHLRMDLPDREGVLVREMRAARNKRMRVLVTAVGTPLWNASYTDGQELPIGLPTYARSAPKDITAWAKDLITLLDDVQERYGLLPDYVEIWNEPDRMEWWEGGREAMLKLIGRSCSMLDRKFGPMGLKVGGPGLANSRSKIDGSVSFLAQIAQSAAQTPFPLHFLSWHHYELGSGLRYYDTTTELREYLTQIGLPDIELFITEWNVFPSPIANPRALDFDGSHAAAQYAAFFSSAVDAGLDGHAFFMALDQGEQAGIPDLTGTSMGLITRHGIRKPVFRVMDFLSRMADEPRVEIRYPEREYGISMYASRLGDRIRVVIANDIVEPGWIWARGCLERDTLPGVLGAAVTNIGYRPGFIPSRQQLMDEGLSKYEAEVARAVLPLVFEGERLAKRPRKIELQASGQRGLRATQAWRFDQTHHNPAAARDQLLPVLQWVERQAQKLAWQRAVDVIVNAGYPKPPKVVKVENAEELALALGIPLSVAEKAWKASRTALDQGRLSFVPLVNHQPATRLHPRDPHRAGLIPANESFALELDPNSVFIVDFELE